MKTKYSATKNIVHRFWNESRIDFVAIFILLAMGTLLLGGCQKNDPQLFSSKPAVYFRDYFNKDSVQFSFVGSAKTADTVRLKVQLMGNALNESRKYKVEVDKSRSTAIEGVHYKKLNDFEVFAEGVFSVDFPLIVYNTDTSLLINDYAVVLKLVPTEELDLGFPDRTSLKVKISNQYVKPDYWDGLLSVYYGVYSRVKHQIVVGLQGVNFPATRNEALAKPPYGVSFWMSWGRVAVQYFTENNVYDENGNLIQPWPPF